MSSGLRFLYTKLNSQERKGQVKDVMSDPRSTHSGINRLPVWKPQGHDILFPQVLEQICPWQWTSGYLNNRENVPRAGSEWQMPSQGKEELKKQSRGTMFSRAECGSARQQRGRDPNVKTWTEIGGLLDQIRTIRPLSAGSPAGSSETDESGR